jgi:hypothetical protein
MIVTSLLVNICVLIPVCFGLLTDTPWATEGYGIASPARGILLSIYVAILFVSFGLLFRRDPLLVAPLLLVQVLYKFSTPFTVGTITNPVVISNLGIASLHLVTLGLILMSVRR